MRKLALGTIAVSYLLWILVSSGCVGETPTTSLPALYASPPSAEVLLARLDSNLASHYSIPKRLAKEIRLAANRHSIPLPLAYALISAESDFTIRALSWAGARGLTQVMPKTGMVHCGLEPDSLYNPFLNLDCGFSYLAMMRARYPTWRLALIAYNRGPSRTSRELAAGVGHGTSSGYARGILKSSLFD